MKKCFALLVLGLLFVGSPTAQAALPDRWTPHLAYHDGTACATTGPYLYALMGENLLIYDTENDAVAFVDRVSAGLSDKQILHIGYSQTRGLLVLLYRNGNIDLYRPRDGQLVNLRAIKQATTENLTVNQLRVQGDDAFVTTNKGFVWIDLTRAEIKGHFPMAACNDVARVGNRLAVATDQGLKTIGVQQNFSDPSLWNNIFAHPVKLLAATTRALYLNVPGGQPGFVGTWRIAADLVEKAGTNDFARVDLLALDRLSTGIDGKAFGYNDRTLLQFDDDSTGWKATGKAASGSAATARVSSACRSTARPSISQRPQRTSAATGRGMTEGISCGKAATGFSLPADASTPTTA